MFTDSDVYYTTISNENLFLNTQPDLFIIDILQEFTFQMNDKCKATANKKHYS